MMRCEEVLAILNDYIDGALDADARRRLAEHIRRCSPCQVVIDNVRHTITLYKAGEPHELPAEFQQSLRELLRVKWRAAFPVAC
jgi:anti-sigma factor RsiW